MEADALAESICHWLTTVAREAGREKGPGHADDAFGGLSARRVAGREHRQIGPQVDLHDFARFEQAVIVLIANVLCELQIRIERMAIVEHAVRGQVKMAEICGEPFDALLIGRDSRQHLAVVGAEDLGELSNLSLCIGQRHCGFVSRPRFDLRDGIAQCKQGIRCRGGFERRRIAVARFPVRVSLWRGGPCSRTASHVLSEADD